MTFSRRVFINGLGLGAAAMASGISGRVNAAGEVAVGILIPGSKSDKGWMESGYDGLLASEKEARQWHQSADDRKHQRTRRYGAGADEPCRPKSALVIGVGGQDTGRAYQGGQALCQGEILDRRRRAWRANPERGPVRREAGGDRFPCRCDRRNAVEDRRRKLRCRRPGDFPRSSTPARSSATARATSSPTSNISRRLCRRLRRCLQIEGGDARRDFPRAPTSTTTFSISGFAAWSRRRARRERTSSAVTPTDAAAIRVYAYSGDRGRIQVQYAIDQTVAGTWAPELQAFRALPWDLAASDMKICAGTAEAEGEAR